MKIKNTHIIFSLLILGIFSLTSVGNDSFSNSSCFIESEIEEVINDTIKLDLEKRFSSSGSDNGGKTTVLTSSEVLRFSFYNTIVQKLTLSSKVSHKPQLFILYCCLKLDC